MTVPFRKTIIFYAKPNAIGEFVIMIQGKPVEFCRCFRVQFKRSDQAQNYIWLHCLYYPNNNPLESSLIPIIKL